MDDRCDLLCLDLDVAERLREGRLDVATATAATKSARALADPTRLVLASALAAAEELCVCDLAWIAERSQGLVSHHLKVLRHAGLVQSRRDGKMVLYTLSRDGHTMLTSLLGAVGAPA